MSDYDARPGETAREWYARRAAEWKANPAPEAWGAKRLENFKQLEKKEETKK